MAVLFLKFINKVLKVLLLSRFVVSIQQLVSFRNLIIGCIFQTAVAGYFVPVVSEKISKMIKLPFPVCAVFRIFEKRLFNIRAGISVI